MLRKKLLVSLLSLSLTISTFSLSPIGEGNARAAEPQGRWMIGEYHAHTYESDDAQHSLTTVLDAAFDQYGMDWLSLSDHLRLSSRDDDGKSLGSKIPLSKGISLYQAPKIKALQDAGKYAGKTIFTGFEWDMPTLDHTSVGIITDNPGSEEALKAINHFEYLFSNRDASLFAPEDVAKWSAESRAYTTAQDTRKGFQWLADHYPDSYALINHPSRKNGTSSELKISDIRDFNNIAPNIAFGFEGMPGNQMSPDRGETTELYGGADVKIAKVGGLWDALLGEGRHFWNFANSDSHFKISSDRKYSSGYLPGEYSKNYTWVNGSGMKAIVEGMRSGKSFSVFGDLINALDFQVESGGISSEMGGELQVTKGAPLQLKIRFKSPDKNNNGDPVQVDHVDLISGEVTGKVQPGTAAYSKATNETTKVVKRFTSADWTTDADGYHTITYELGEAGVNQYFRLRGTNLGTDVPGETSHGEPLIDPKNTTVDNETRFKEINDRNYKDLWFYSNPIFVNVSYDDSQAVEEALQGININTDNVTSDFSVPLQGKQGATIQWQSSDPSIATINGGTVQIKRPAIGQPDAKVTLTATATMGSASNSRTFEVTIKSLGTNDSILWYTFDSNASDTVVPDRSGHNNNGTLIGGAALSGQHDGSVELDGVDGAVQLPNGILAGLTDATITMNVNVDSSAARPSWFFSLSSAANAVSGTKYLGLLEDGGGKFRASITPNYYVAEQTVTKGATLDRGVWKSIAYSISGTTATLYEDGVQIAQNTGVTLKPQDIEATIANYIGRPAYSGDKFLKGSVSDFRIYPRALSTEEVAAVAADNLTGKGAISGKVTDGTNPVEGAIVSLTIDGQKYSALTAADGSYTIASVPVGTGYVITAEKEGYLGNSNPVNVTADQQTSDVNITMSKVVINRVVTFDKNGGDTEATPSSMTVQDGGTLGALPSAPTRTGYSFIGWNTKADGTGTALDADTLIHSNLTVYAQWLTQNPPNPNPVPNPDPTPSPTPSPTPIPMPSPSPSPVQNDPYVKQVYIQQTPSVVNIDLTKGSTLLSSAQMTNLTQLNKDHDIEFSGTNYSMTFPAGTMASVTGKGDYDFGLGVNAGTNYNEIKQLAGDCAAVMVNYKLSGTLSGQVQIKLKVGSQYAGQKLYYYYFNEASRQLEFIQSTNVDSNGYAAVAQTHFSDYVFLTRMLGSTDRPEVLTVKPSIVGESAETVVPYYMKNGKEIIVKLSAMLDGTLYYIGDTSTEYKFKNNAKSFKDTKGNWAEEAINFVTARELFDGTTRDTFSPNAPMTRGMIVTVLGRLLGVDVSDNTASRYVDVQPGSYYAEYVNWASQSNIVKGIGGNRFEPNAPVTREQLAVILANFIQAAKLENGGTTGSKAAAFTDDRLINSWAKTSVAALVDAQIMSGKGKGDFDPQGKATRAELATILQRVIERHMR